MPPETLARKHPYDVGHVLGMPFPGEHLVVGRGGWLHYQHPDISADVYVRVVERPDGRLEVGDLYLRAGSEAVTADLLRRLSIDRIERAISSPARALRVRDQAQEEAAEVEQDVAELLGRIAPARTGPLGAKERAPRIRLRIPTERRKPNAFYQSVAEAFSFLATTSKAPAQELAAANNVPVTTVHRWVKEALARGLLPPARRERVTKKPREGER